MLFRSLLLAVPAAADIVYVGSGGCDVADVGCKDDAEQEHVIQAVQVEADGAMKVLPDSAIPTGGMPVWLIPHISSEGRQCLFVTLADQNMVAAYSVDPIGSNHELVGKYASGGAAPVHGSTLMFGDVLLVANYHGPDDATTSDGASAASMRISGDCSLALADSKPHNGSSVIPDRQSGAHVHSFVAGLGGRGYACDLGMDKVFVYTVEKDGKLSQADVADATPGFGPRHSVARKGFLYVVNEMGEAVTVFREDGEGKLEQVQSLTLIPQGQTGDGSKAAEIVGHGDFLYATNRGMLNTVTVLAIEKDGKVAPIQTLDVPAYPRGMTLVQEGKILLVAGQSKTEMASYLVGNDGKLSATSYTLGPGDGLPPHPAAFGAVALPSVSALQV